MLASYSLLLIKCSTKAQRSRTSAHRMLLSLGKLAGLLARWLTTAAVGSLAWARGAGAKDVVLWGVDSPPEGDTGWGLLARRPSAE